MCKTQARKHASTQARQHASKPAAAAATPTRRNGNGDATQQGQSAFETLVSGKSSRKTFSDGVPLLNERGENKMKNTMLDLACVCRMMLTDTHKKDFITTYSRTKKYCRAGAFTFDDVCGCSPHVGVLSGPPRKHPTTFKIDKIKDHNFFFGHHGDCT